MLWDRDLAGFGLKVTPASGKVYLVQYRTGGRGSPTKRVTIGRHGLPWTPELARKEARRILGEVAGGKDPAGEKSAVRRQRAPENAVAAVVENWLRRDQAKNRTADEVHRVIQREVRQHRSCGRSRTSASAT